MKKICSFLVLATLVVGCSTPRPQSTSDTNHTSLKAQQNEEGEYDLEVLDSRFDYFMKAIARPMSMYSESYLKNRNQFLVTEWNSLYFAGRYRNIIESSIDYDPNINYGLKYEYKLYQVFEFVRWKYGLRLNGLR